MAQVIRVEEKIDYSTGEVKETTTVRQYRGEEPSYIKLYLKDISCLYALPSTTSDLMYELLKYVTYGTQEIVLNAVTKARIAEKTGMAKQTINNRLQDLQKKGIIARVGPGTFTLNPYLFGKGDWKTIRELRNKNLHLQITYDSETNERTIRGTVNKKATNDN